MKTTTRRLTVLALDLLAGLLLAAVRLTAAGSAHADPDLTLDQNYYLYCLKSNGINIAANRNMYLSVGETVARSLTAGTTVNAAVAELIKEGADQREAATIAACSTHLRD